MPSSHFYQHKILFVLRTTEHYYYFKSIIDALAHRGHKIRVLFDRDCSSKSLNRIKKSSGVDYAWATYETSKFRKLLFHLHDLLSYRKYLIVGNQSSFYRERWAKYYLFAPFRFLLKLPILESLLVSSIAAWVIKKILIIAPADGKVFAQIKIFSPDVVVVSPADMPFLSADKQYLIAAKRLAVPSVLPVFSWDNLTTKGVIFPHPDLLLAWNRIQVKEAVYHHGISKKLIKITGAPLFDFWFDIKKPSVSRRDFCRKLGFSESDPILLYVESSDSLTGDERWVVKKVKDWLRSAKDKRISNTGIIVRPHPFYTHFGGFKQDGIIVVPKGSVWPDGREAAQLYYDCLYYSFAVCGINTTGFIDAAILNRPTVGILFDEYRRIQSETSHFRQLMDNKVIDLARNEKDFLDFCARVANGQDSHKLERQLFVRNFIRPRGLKIVAGEIAAREIERRAITKAN